MSQGFDFADAPQPEQYGVCVHCGLCLDACPTYQELGVENQSPRGRVYLIRAVAEGAMPLDMSLSDPVFRCLDCRACESVCPSGVPVGALIEEARGQVVKTLPERGAGAMLRRFVLRGLFPYPRRLARIGSMLRMYQRSGIRSLAHRLGLLQILPQHLRDMERALPAVPKPSRERLPDLLPAKGARRGRVGVFLGCVADTVFAGTNEATARVLARNGFDVLMPPAQSCCGALHVHAGDRDTAKRLARRNIDAFLAAGVEAVVVNAAGCGAAMKEYGEWLCADPVYGEQATRFADLVKDVSEFLVGQGFSAPATGFSQRVTYHEACHLCHAQKIRSQPRAVLQSIPNLSLVEMDESDRCCGAAGIYNLTYPEMASRLLERKMANVPAGIATIATANPGCMLQLMVGAERTGRDIKVRHVVDLLDEAYAAEEQVTL